MASVAVGGDAVAVDGNFRKEGEAAPASPLAGKDLREIALGEFAGQGKRASGAIPAPGQAVHFMGEAERCASLPVMVCRRR